MTDKVSIVISVADQVLTCVDQFGHELLKYRVSTAKNGVGQEYGSECTPLGSHTIHAKIGDDQPINTVFIARKPSGEVYSDRLAKQHPQRDWILTRILWLGGCEQGINLSGQVDTLQRCIYIHGAPDSHPIGVPSSHGCIKMRNKDIIPLFDVVSEGTQVMIRN